MKRMALSLTLLGLTVAGCQSTGDLGGTSWTVVELLAATTANVTDMDVHFETSGWVTTNLTMSDGSTETTRHRYRVHESLLVIDREEPKGDLNLLHRIDGDAMYLTDEDFQARLQRIDMMVGYASGGDMR